MRAQSRRNRFDLSAAEQCCCFGRADMRCDAINDVNADGFGKACGFDKARRDITHTARPAIRMHDDGPRAPAQTVFTLKFETTQDLMLFLIIRAFFGKVERMRGLNGRYRMFVNQLDHPVALKQRSEERRGGKECA